jgi:pimeloyl-ACP methyl ester carboxylesterase
MSGNHRSLRISRYTRHQTPREVLVLRSRTPLVALLMLLIVVGCRAADARPAASARTLAEAPDRWLRGPDVLLRYREIGAGEPMILVHGYTDRVEMWNGPADSLARDFRVIVPDMRGFGLASKSGDTAYFGRRMVDDVLMLMDSLGIARAHLVGYSMGGQIVGNLALDHPGRTASVTLVAGALWADSVAMARDVAPFVAALRDERTLAPFFKWILPTWDDTTVAAVAAHLYAANDRPSLIASLASLPALAIDSSRMSRAHVPAALVVSGRDPLAPHSRQAARWWPGARLVVIPTHDHADITFAPEVLAETRAVAGRAAPSASRPRPGVPR